MAQWMNVFWNNDLVNQGVVTFIKCIEPFATGIKMKSTDQEVIFD